MVANHDVNPTEAYTYLANNFTRQKDFSGDFEAANFLAPTSFILKEIKMLPPGPIDPRKMLDLVDIINESNLSPRMQHEEIQTLMLIQQLKAQQPINQNNTSRFGN